MDELDSLIRRTIATGLIEPQRIDENREPRYAVNVELLEKAERGEIDIDQMLIQFARFVLKKANEECPTATPKPPNSTN